MSTNVGSKTYQQVVTTTKIYLGPAAERFIYRQVKNHLEKEPDELKPADLSVLIDWIRIAVSFLTEDSNLIDEYVHQLKQISEPIDKDGR